MHSVEVFKTVTVRGLVFGLKKDAGISGESKSGRINLSIKAVK